MYRIEITPTTGAAAIEYYERSWIWAMIRLLKITWHIGRVYRRPDRTIVFAEQEDDDNRTQVGWVVSPALTQRVSVIEAFMEINIEELPASSDQAGEPVL